MAPAHDAQNGLIAKKASIPRPIGSSTIVVIANSANMTSQMMFEKSRVAGSKYM